MDQSQYWLYAYQQSLPADYYIIRLVDASGKNITQPRRYSYHQLIKSWKYLRYMNRRGYHIYGRPEGYEFIFIDDIPRKKLWDLVELKPALAMESSPDNFQAFLHFKKAPDSREYAASICRNVCSYLDADSGSAEPDHLGRLPGFKNLKPEHLKNGKYPMVILHHAMDQFTTYSLRGRQAEGGVVPGIIQSGVGYYVNLQQTDLQTILIPYAAQERPFFAQKSSFVAKKRGEIVDNRSTNAGFRSIPAGNRSNIVNRSEGKASDRSSKDFFEVMTLLEQGIMDDESLKQAISISEKAKERGEKYVERTIYNAKKKYFRRLGVKFN